MLTPEQRKLQEDFSRGKKRTCPRCGEIFVTRRDKRIHRKTAPDCKPVEADVSQHRYA